MGHCTRRRPSARGRACAAISVRAAPGRPALGALRKRFPNNLQNGMGIKQRLKLTDPKTGAQVVKEQLQSSMLVAVPKE